MENTNQAWHTEYSIETSATPARIWDILRDVPGWKKWNPGIEEITLEGPFQNGTWLSMKPPGQDPLRSRLIDVREGEGFVDETRLGELVVTVAHRIQSIAEGRTRITYSVDAQGPESADVGPAIAADFPEVLAGLAALATEAS